MLLRSLKHMRGFCSHGNNSFYVTTPIFYVNAAPHIGHLYSAVIADAICRYQSLRYPAMQVRLCTGTDEHGTKIQQAAPAHNVPVAQYCDNISQSYRDIFQQANIQHTDFIRTTEQRHKAAVAHFWRQLKNNGHIYSAQYSGWYCVSDETFLTDSQLRLDETTGLRYSLESGHTVEWTEETNYMFSLSKLQDDVIYWLKQGEQVKPLKFEKILLDMLSEQLPDVSVSRPANRVHWAIQVPDDATQTVYVWLDALINYLTSVGYPDERYRQHWPPAVQVIGKDILKFHGIYWPAFLIAAGMEPPAKLLVHSHWTVDGQKMSKSKNNVVNPLDVAQQYSMEGLRYFLLREGVPHSDGNYSNTKALRILNSELADTLGNLLSRVCAKSLNPRQIYPALQLADLELIMQLGSAKRLQEALDSLEAKCAQHYEEYNFYLAVDTIIHTLHAANNFFEQMRPWEYKVGGKQENAQRLETIIAMTMDALRLCGIALQPIVPQLTQRLLDKLNVPQEERLWCCLHERFNAALKSEKTVTAMPLSGTLNATVATGKVHALCNADAVLFRRIIMPAAGTAAGMPSPSNVKKKTSHATKKATN